jgi:hypothetical protein
VFRFQQSHPQSGRVVGALRIPAGGWRIRYNKALRGTFLFLSYARERERNLAGGINTGSAWAIDQPKGEERGEM